MATKKQQPKQKHPLLAGLAKMPHAEQFEQNVAAERARQFEALGNDPLAWLECADCLLRSARAILDRAPHEPGCLVLPALMLRGFALENLLRAVQARKQPLVQGGKLSLNGSKSHRLLELAEAVLGPFRERVQILDLGMLQSLTAAVRYSGRYPVPVEPGETVVVRGTFEEPGASWDREKETRFRMMVLRLVAIVKDDPAAAEASRAWWDAKLTGDPPYRIPLPSRQRDVRRAMKLPAVE
ncbi:MAG: hypothetical protein ACK53W_00540 [Gemmatimonadota bacterium]